MKTSLRHILVAASSFILLPSAFPQGSLTPPPGAPAPTMKTLDQVEARTPLPGGTSPLSIGTSGSYYLTGNVTISTTAHGITVSASDVTIDLNGFTLAGPSSGLSSGIYLTGGISNVTIVNGTIRNWGIHGINALGNPHLRAEKLRVISNGGFGIGADMNADVINCVAQANVDTGIFGTDHCLIKDCQVTGTTGTGAFGISVGRGCLVTGCIASNNGAGISVSDASTVSGCTTQLNLGPFTNPQIAATSDCLIISNHCATRSRGISITGDRNRIEANTITSDAPLFAAPKGIYVTGIDNLIIRNSVASATYEIAANNKVGFIVVPPYSGAISGSGGAGVGTSDPWANFAY